MNWTPPQTRQLAVLRAILDAIDRDVLQLLSRRMGIVAEIAGHKREQGLPVRDIAREREVLDDRQRRARELGIPTGLVESIYRLILLASRDQQASMRAEVPVTVEPRRVAVIGGKGGMGACMARLFSDIGHEVITADIGTKPSAVEIATTADVVIVSVPIRVTETVIREVGPHVRPDSLLLDVTSVKELPMKVMLESTKASVVGTHPMFGPGINTIQGQRVVVCPGRGDAWHEWLCTMLKARGLSITHATAEEHDRIMAVVQVLNHFQTQVHGLTLKRLGVPLERTLEFTSPAYLLETCVAARHFAQSPELYGAIEMLNHRTHEVTTTFRECAAELSEILDARDQTRFTEMFEEVRGFFGSFTEEALEQSRFLMDRLIELTAGRRGTDTRTSPTSEA